MKLVLSLVSIGFVSLAVAQDDASDRKSALGAGSNSAQQQAQLKTTRGFDGSQSEKRSLPNPFDLPARNAGSMSDMGSGDMEGMMGMEASGGYGMESDMMGMGGYAPADPFQRGLQRAIEMLRKARSPTDKATLEGYIRKALEDRYAAMLQKRKKELEQLKASLAKLESDWKRRAGAKDRVVQVQMQSVQLAAEGLLDLNQGQASMGFPAGGGFAGSEYGNEGGYGGGGYGEDGSNEGEMPEDLFD